MGARRDCRRVTGGRRVCAAGTGPRPVDTTAARLTIPLAGGRGNHVVSGHHARRPDGGLRRAAGHGGCAALPARSESFEARAVAGSGGAQQPFFSPDGKWVAFFAQGQLQKAEVAGGAPIRLAEAAYPFGGTWTEDNTIIYVASLGSGLLRVPASGGTPESLTKPDGAAKGYAHVFPQALPGGRSVLFTVWGQTQGARCSRWIRARGNWCCHRRRSAPRRLTPPAAPTGRLLLVDQAAGLRAAPFDPAHPARTSADTSVLQDVYYEVETESRGWLAISKHRHGRLRAWQSGQIIPGLGGPRRKGRTGWARTRTVPRSQPVARRHEGRRPARPRPVDPRPAARDPHAADVRRRQQHSAAVEPRRPADPVRVESRRRLGHLRAAVRRIAARPTFCSSGRTISFPYSILPDGTLLYTEIQPKTGRDIWTLSPTARPRPARHAIQRTGSPVFAWPGGRAALDRVCVRRIGPERGLRAVVPRRASTESRCRTEAGSVPMWSPDGKELFYVTATAWWRWRCGRTAHSAHRASCSTGQLSHQRPVP